MNESGTKSAIKQSARLPDASAAKYQAEPFAQTWRTGSRAATESRIFAATGSNQDYYRHSDLAPESQKKDKLNRPLRNAAVLIPLLRQNDAWHILFIRRTENKNDRHSGQVAFPGGAQDQSDNTLVETALRETREEVGISADNIKVLSSLKPYKTVSFYKVTPVVGLLNWPCTMSLQVSEVARAFTIPLDWLRNEDNFELRERPAAKGEASADSRRYPVVYFREYDGETLWGASARMTLNFLKALGDKELLLPG